MWPRRQNACGGEAHNYRANTVSGGRASANPEVTMSPTATTGMTFEKTADSLEQLILVARHIFTQALEFVDLLESDGQLTGDSNYLPGSTIGMVCQ